ncbi:MAG: preprotein translocase subunit SecE [Acetomicrobium sp.]|uniref:preprotein translocase subunit SecE n=1 Tax=Acetomicrobium TaxID=49894 RepID=UPI0016AB3D26|nr:MULTISPECIES: preprotein translocase subunit SecE [Acetomicrobium]NLI43273.1 preprotein translocase subunit SecE [Synergistaceae bacterium]MDR9770129.1 preprotein translocase subunit SecE [Acetomicrobium sp.]HOB11185.1 preprotein translocase subunit SecE [Acetomicrobium sp.]HOM98206.1 preprotein translocase subunit SecE [Acetomicrobium sp.]HPT65358.1 preprotein translocase subunit SecE [Acetomicrobium sp.]
MDKIFSFLREARAELKRVTWPNKKQVWISTLLVIVVTLLVSAYLGVLDLIFTAVFSKIVG